MIFPAGVRRLLFGLNDVVAKWTTTGFGSEIVELCSQKEN